MPRVFYLSPVVGSGTATDPYRAKVQDYPVSAMAVAIPSNPDKTPVFSWTVCAVDSTTETAALQADPTVTRIPPGKMTTLIQDLTAAQQNRITTWLSNQGISAQVNVQPATDTVRDLIRKIAVVLFTQVAQEWAVE